MSNETIQDGWYDAKAKNWRWKQASTGTWQLEIWFELTDKGAPVGEMPGWFAVTDNTIEKRVEQFTALGYQPVTGDIGQEIGADEAGTCFGGLDANAVRVVVKTEAGRDGVPRQKVDNIAAMKGGHGAGQTADVGELRKFGAQMRGAVMAAAQRAKAGAPQGAAQPRPAPTQQCPAPTPSRGPGASRPVAQRDDFPVDDYTAGGSDDIPF